MNFEPVHIHKSQVKSLESLVFFLIPILLFVVTLLFIASKEPLGKVSGVSTQNSLTGESQK